MSQIFEKNLPRLLVSLKKLDIFSYFSGLVRIYELYNSGCPFDGSMYTDPAWQWDYLQASVKENG